MLYTWRATCEYSAWARSRQTQGGILASQARAQGMVPVWIFLPQVRQGTWQDATAGAVQIAREAGFVVINMEDVYDGQDIEEIRLAEWDEHPNSLGHRLVAERLYTELDAQRSVVFSRPN